MFRSDYNLLGCKLLDSYDLITAPQIVVISSLNGLGKTTLLRRIAVKVKNTGRKTMLIDAEKFATKYAFAAQTGQLSPFRKNMRSNDLLLVDNINSLRGKKRSVEELFHTFESIFAKGGKVVITYRGNQPSYDFLGEKFASRLRCGLVITLKEPANEEIMKYIEYYLQKHYPETDLELKGEFTIKAKNLHLITENIERILGKSTYHEKESIPVSYIKKSMEYEVKLLSKLIGEYFELEESKILGNSRNSTVVKGRYLLYLILHELYEYSYKDIAQYFQKDSSNMKRQSIIIKEKYQESFERLCQKLYNQVTAEK